MTISAMIISKKSITSGFTLIECLVALLIVAVILASASRAIGISVNDAETVYQRNIANWIASNSYNQSRIDETFPELGISKNKITMAEMNFTVKKVVSTTPNPYFRKLNITVINDNKPNYVLYHSVNFIAQY